MTFPAIPLPADQPDHFNVVVVDEAGPVAAYGNLTQAEAVHILQMTDVINMAIMVLPPEAIQELIAGLRAENDADQDKAVSDFAAELESVSPADFDF